MKVAITGATGFLGRTLTAELLARGHEVSALTRSAEKGRKKLDSRVQVLEWDLPALGPWADTFRTIDGVVNLAGEPILNHRWTREQKERILSSRVGATRAVVDAIKRAAPRPKVLVNQSAIGYYGSQGDTILTESSPPGNDLPAYVVERWETAAMPVEEAGVRLVILRTAIVLGKSGGALPPMLLPFRMFAGGTLGEPGQWFSWIALDDELELFVRALTSDQMRGVYNASAPNPVTMDVFSRQIGQVLGRPSWVPMYGTLMKIALGSERGRAALTSQRVIPKALEAEGYTFRHTRSDEALRSVLGR
jgi:uncharacterized protein (TIGR01777 family)